MKMFMHIYKWFLPKHAYVGSMISLIFVNRHLSRHSVLNNVTNQINDILLTLCFEDKVKIKSCKKIKNIQIVNYLSSFNQLHLQIKTTKLKLLFKFSEQ